MKSVHYKTFFNSSKMLPEAMVMVNKMILLFLLWVGVISCHNADITSKPAPTSSKKYQDSVAIHQRQLLIGELVKLKAIFASGDRNKIEQLTHLHLIGDSLRIAVNDSTYYPGGISELNNLFKFLQLDSLNLQNEIQFDQIIPSKPCYKFYTIHIEDTTVSLVTGSNTNIDFTGPKKKHDPVKSGEECEWSLYWVFRWNGKKLLFQRFDAAG